MIFERLGQDVRYSFRSLRRAPGSMIVIIVTLAVAIGAAIVAFQAAVAVALHPLPFPSFEMLVAITESVSAQDAARAGQHYASYGTYADLRENAAVFEEIAIYDAVQKRNYRVLTGGGEPERIVSVRASAGLFKVLGVRPIVGRSFGSDEELGGGSSVAVISERLWRRRFQSRPDIVGEPITLNQTVHTVIGVAPDSLSHAPFYADVWTPLQAHPSWREERLSLPFRIVARMKPGVNVDVARDAAARVYLQAGLTRPALADSRISVLSLAEVVAGKVRLYVAVLSLAVACVLLVACANAGSILLARAASRAPEFAVRVSIGANQGRLISLFVADSLLLSLAAGSLGVAAAYATARSVAIFAPLEIPDAAGGTVGTEVFIVAFALVLATTVLCSGIPAAVFARSKDIYHSLKESGTGIVALRHRRAQRGLAIMQIGLGLVLSAATLMLFGSHSAITTQELGFDPEKTVTFQVAVRGTPLCLCTRLSQQSEFYTGLLAGLSIVPGVISAGAVSDLPLVDSAAHIEFQSEGSVGRAFRLAGVRSITPSYFKAMQVQIVAGRMFGSEDTPKSEEVAIINQTMAKSFGVSTDVVGRRFRFNPRSDGSWLRVIGVARDMKQVALEADAEPEVFLPHTQAPSSLMRVVVRSNEAPATIIPALRKAVANYDRYIPLAEAKPMTEILSDAVAGRRFTVLVLAALSSLVLMSAITGVYGTQSYAVARRRREIGLRLALGASRNGILLWIMADAGKLASIGIVAGVVGTTLLMGALRPLLFGITTYGFRYVLAAALVMLSGAMAGSYLPARSAAHVEPSDALRHE